MTLDELVALLEHQHAQMGLTIGEIKAQLPPPPGGPITFVVTPASQPQGTRFNLTWTNVSGTTVQTWAGLYRHTQPDSPSIGYVYLNSLTQVYGSTPVGASGSILFPLCTPPCTSRNGMPTDLAAGEYEFRLFLNDNGNSKVATSNLFTVTAKTPIITSSLVIAMAGDHITANWKDIVAPTGRDWIGLFKQNALIGTSRTIWSYTNGTKTPGTIGLASGAIPFVVPTLPAGMYEFRLFAADSSTLLLATSQPIEIRV